MVPNAPRSHRDQEQRQQRNRKNQVPDLFWLRHRRLEADLLRDHIADVPGFQSVALRHCANVHITTGRASNGAGCEPF